MKNAMIVAVLMASASISHAQYAGSTIALTTVSALLENGRNDQQVVLQGRIIRHTGEEAYRFADNTGETEIEIDAKNWRTNTPIDKKQRSVCTASTKRSCLVKRKSRCSRSRLSNNGCLPTLL